MVERDLDSVVTIQKILTRYGCTIRTRLGVNEKFFGKDAGLIILELNGDISQMELLIIDLRKQTKTLVRKLIF
jgi:hypothetical protein